MAAGCIPFISNLGGHKEIIENGVNGFLWDDTSELYRFTKDVIRDEKKRKEIAAKSVVSSKKFSYEEFEKNFSSLL